MAGSAGTGAGGAGIGDACGGIAGGACAGTGGGIATGACAGGACAGGACAGTAAASAVLTFIARPLESADRASATWRGEFESAAFVRGFSPSSKIISRARAASALLLARNFASAVLAAFPPAKSPRKVGISLTTSIKPPIFCPGTPDTCPICGAPPSALGGNPVARGVGVCTPVPCACPCACCCACCCACTCWTPCAVACVAGGAVGLAAGLGFVWAALAAAESPLPSVYGCMGATPPANMEGLMGDPGYAGIGNLRISSAR